MATKVQNYDEVKLFKIVHLNLRGKVKEWYKCIELAPVNWATLKATMEQKYGVIDPKEIIMQLDIIKQEPLGNGCNCIMIDQKICLQGEFF